MEPNFALSYHLRTVADCPAAPTGIWRRPLDSSAQSTSHDSNFVEPAQCVPPIRDLWRRAGRLGLNRAIANVVVQRLRPDLTDKMPWPLETTAMGPRQLCFIYPTIPPQGHWFTLAKGTCDAIEGAAAKQLRLPPEQRANVVLLAVWRAQEVGADRRLHVWAIPADVVALMSKRLDSAKLNNRNVGIDPPVSGRPSVWRKGKDDPDPIPLQDFYRRYTLSDQELKYLLDAEQNEIKQTRVRDKRAPA